MRKSTIPEWAIVRERFQRMSQDDELAQDLQFISYLLVFGSSVRYGDLTPMERAAADRLLRMGVLTELAGPGRQIMLTRPWKKAFEKRQLSSR
jgi:hypothetical protein